MVGHGSETYKDCRLEGIIILLMESGIHQKALKKGKKKKE